MGAIHELTQYAAFWVGTFLGIVIGLSFAAAMILTDAWPSKGIRVRIRKNES